MKQKKGCLNPYFRFAGLLLVLMFHAAQFLAATGTAGVLLIADPESGPVATHGLSKIEAALKNKGVALERATALDAAKGGTLIVAGLASGSGPAARLLKDFSSPPPTAPEALAIRRTRWNNKPALLVCGADDRGLMYALLDVAERVGWAKDASDPLSEVRDVEEKPAVAERALSIYTMHRAYFESRLYDEKYWDCYFDMLAANRFNSFVLIFGYENGGYMAPPYPYFFDVEGFPDVRVVGLTKEQQQKNLDSLNRLIAQAHARGIRVTLGIWDHIYRGGVQTGGLKEANDFTKKPTPGLVWGVTTENLTAYTQAALAKLVKAVPKMDAVQFRMHDESGLKTSEQYGFWKNVFGTMKQNAPHLRFDARAKGLPDEVIQAGLDAGVPLRVTTKYWMEQMGMPFHPTHINRQNQQDRRHSYSDLLRYPQQYRMHWRLWNGGTARVLLWGDPDWVRRFCESTHLYDGDGFEVNEPLCTKMEAQPHDMKPFDLLNPMYRYSDYEFERYWHFFQLFGRLGYNPNAGPEIWQREFERRFGKDAAPHVERALNQASRVLPRIVAACYPYRAFPMTRGWAERQRLGDLPQYAQAEGSDIQQFLNFDEEAQLRIEGTSSAKTRPLQTSEWFDRAAKAILDEAASAELRIGKNRNNEFRSTIVDLKILANLALFHSRRIPAAVNYRLFVRTQDVTALDAAIVQEQSAIKAWEKLVEAAGDVYAADLMMGYRGADLCGHWRDELAALKKGLAKLQEERITASEKTKGDKPAIAYAPIRTPAPGEDIEPPTVAHKPILTAPAGKPLKIAAKVSDPSGVEWVRVLYRSVNQRLDYKTLPMQPVGAPGHYEAEIPASELDPQWDFMYLLEVMDKKGNGKIHPDLEKETPYVVVRLQR